MGSEPNIEFGSKKEDIPPSLTLEGA